MAHDLFISYSTQDKAIADRLVHELEAKEVRCWIAPRDITLGADWQQSILDAIASAKALVLVFSAGANTSPTVRKEVLAAVESNVLVIPFRVEDVRPQGALRFNLIDVHWLDAVTPPLDPHIDLLVDRVARLTEDFEPPSDPPADPDPPPARRKRRPRKTPVRDDATPKEADEVKTPAEPAPAPKPAPPVPPPPPDPAPRPVLTDEEKQRRQNVIIIGAVAIALVVVLLLAFCRPRPDPDPPSYPETPSASDANSSSSADDTSPPSNAAVSDISTLTSSDDKNRVVEIINQTGKPMVGLYASAPTSSWGANRMSGTLASGSSYKFNLSDGTTECYLDVKGVFDDATYSSTPRFHVCGQSTLTFTSTVAPSS